MITLQSPADLKALRESVAVECKLAAGRDGQGAVPEDFWKTYCAFANTQGGESDCRNRNLHGMFLPVGLGERAGSGLSRIRKGWEGEVRLADTMEPYDQTRLELALPKEAEGAPVKSTLKSSEKSSEKILLIIGGNNAVSIAELAASLGVTTRAIEKRLAALKAAGRLRRIGPDKGGRWEVVE